MHAYEGWYGCTCTYDSLITSGTNILESRRTSALRFYIRRVPHNYYNARRRNVDARIGFKYIPTLNAGNPHRDRDAYICLLNCELAFIENFRSLKTRPQKYAFKAR